MEIEYSYCEASNKEAWYFIYDLWRENTFRKKYETTLVEIGETFIKRNKDLSFDKIGRIISHINGNNSKIKQINSNSYLHIRSRKYGFYFIEEKTFELLSKNSIGQNLLSLDVGKN